MLENNSIFYMYKNRTTVKLIDVDLIKKQLNALYMYIVL